MPKQKWREAFALMVHGQDESGDDMHMTIEPFRTKEMAEKHAKAAFKGFGFSVLFTMVPDGTRFKGMPRKKPKKVKRG